MAQENSRRGGAGGISRRGFIKATGIAAGIGMLPGPLRAATAGGGLSLVIDPRDGIAASAPAGWAIRELQEALAARQISVRIRDALDRVPAGEPSIVVSGIASPTAQDLLQRSRAALTATPETLYLVSSGSGGRTVLLAGGSDARGLVYAATELADRVRHSADPVAALRIRRPIIQRPANAIRSIARLFASDVEDKSWFHDRDMWRAYLSVLATHRFNRFNLTFGLQYNYPVEVSDVYLYFAYPFLLAVPGYEVRARALSDAERDRNLETLRFIGEESVRRGLAFHLALWTHGYKFDSPKVNYLIEGITPDNHAGYCRDALALLLKTIPTISGLTFRIHGESGIAEGNYEFWRTVFEGIGRSGRRVEIDMHAKGIDQKTIDLALATGMPVTVSPKYMGEHMGLPYHQASIRAYERRPREGADTRHFGVSYGARNFMRYSYGDLLDEDRRHGVLFRIWPGTQRVLLWGDPAMAAGYGRHASFCGSQGVELCEPLSFKGRMGSGQSGNRTAYVDASLAPAYDWQKYAYTYRIWGRLTYDPDAEPETWRRYLQTTYGPAAGADEAALSHASRILPLVTLAHAPSASNNAYWPELYTNMAIVHADPPRPYYDSPKPPRFGTAETFDPQLFSRVDEFAQELLRGERTARYSPLDVAQWLEEHAREAARQLGRTRKARPKDVEQRRLFTDVAIQTAIGLFFAAKFRSAVLWSLYENSGERSAAGAAIEAYRAARRAWADAATAAQGVYVAEITYGKEPWLRGHWSDRLRAIDADIADMEKRAKEGVGAQPGDQERARTAVRAVLAWARARGPDCRHEPPARFQPGEALQLSITVPGAPERQLARLHYRRVNQAEAWQATEMGRRGTRYEGVVPAEYSRSSYPIQYYFEIRENGDPTLYPGLEQSLSNQPYFVVRRA